MTFLAAYMLKQATQYYTTCIKTAMFLKSVTFPFNNFCSPVSSGESVLNVQRTHSGLRLTPSTSRNIFWIRACQKSTVWRVKTKFSAIARSVAMSLGNLEAPRSILASGTSFHEDLVMTILTLPLIQGEHLSVDGEKMCT